MLIAPWIIRNYSVADQFVYLDTRTGYNLYIGYNPDATGRFNWESVTVLNNIIDDTERHNWGMQHAIEYIKEHPSESLLLIPKKFFYFWDLDKTELITAYSWNYMGEFHPVGLFFTFFLIMSPFALIVVLGIIGTVFTKLNKRIWLLLSIIFFYTILHSLTLAESRSHMVLVPFLSILAACGLASISGGKSDSLSTNQQSKNKITKKLVICLAIVCVFIFIWAYGIYIDLPKFEAIFSPGGNRTYLPY